MKLGKVNSRLTKLGSKVRGDISKAVGKTSKVITQVEKGAKKAVTEVAKVADSAAVRGIQQGTLIAGRALGATGVPEAQALGVGLTGIGMGIKEARGVIPSKAELVKKKIGVVGQKGREQVRGGARELIAGTRKADAYRQNILEKPEPKVNLMDELPMYVD